MSAIPGFGLELGQRGMSARKPGAHTRTLILELVAERHRQGMTQAEVAGLLGMSPANFGNFERGSCCPSAEYLAAWAEALGRTLTLGERAS